MSKPITIPVWHRKHTTYKGNYIGRILIKKTNRKVPKSKHFMYFSSNSPEPYRSNPDVLSVQDIKKVHKPSVAGYPEKIISLFDETIKEQKDDWSVTLAEMSGFEAGDKLVMKKVKPSLLTKLKNRFKK